MTNTDFSTTKLQIMKISQTAIIFLSTLIGSEAANGGNGGQGGNGGGGRSSKLNCGDTIEGSVTLVNSLTCDNTSGTAAITVAPGATLDCAGHSIIGRNTLSDFEGLCESCPTLGVKNALSGSNAINLENGGTVINCVVTGFHQGILVLDASANVMNTKVYNSLRDGYVHSFYVIMQGIVYQHRPRQSILYYFLMLPILQL